MNSLAHALKQENIIQQFIGHISQKLRVINGHNVQVQFFLLCSITERDHFLHMVIYISHALSTHNASTVVSQDTKLNEQTS